MEEDASAFEKEGSEERRPRLTLKALRLGRST